MGDRGIILLLMTYDLPNNKDLWARGIDPRLRGSVHFPDDRRKLSIWEIWPTPRIPIHNLKPLDEHITDQVTKCL